MKDISSDFPIFVLLVFIKIIGFIALFLYVHQKLAVTEISDFKSVISAGSIGKHSVVVRLYKIFAL